MIDQQIEDRKWHTTKPPCFSAASSCFCWRLLSPWEKVKSPFTLVSSIIVFITMNFKCLYWWIYIFCCGYLLGSTVQGTLVCNEIYGTQVGDTCFSIIEAFHLTASTFNTYNPNLNCQKVFVGEWLCINGMVVWRWFLPTLLC